LRFFILFGVLILEKGGILWFRVSGWKGCGYSVSWAVCLSHSMIRQPINSDQLGCACEKKIGQKCPWAGQLDGPGLEWT